MGVRALAYILALATLMMTLLFGYAFWELVVIPLFANSDPKLELKFWFELIYFISGVGILATAITALYGANKQIKLIHLSHEHDVHQRKALVYLEMENRWASPTMMVSKNKIAGLVSQVNPNNLRNNLFRSNFSNDISNIRKTDRKHYLSLLGPINFLESVGVMVEKGYLEYEDVDALMAPALRLYDDVFRLHLLQRRKEFSPSTKERARVDLYGYTIRLLRTARLRRQGKQLNR
jgi:hypothetical protein